MALANPPMGAPVTLPAAKAKPRFGRTLFRGVSAVIVLLLIGLLGFMGATLSSTSSELDKAKAQVSTRQQVADYSVTFYLAVAQINGAVSKFHNDLWVHRGDSPRINMDLVAWHQTMDDVTRQVQDARVPEPLVAADREVKMGLQTMTTATAKMQDGFNRQDDATFNEGGRLVSLSWDQLDRAQSMVKGVLSPAH